MLALHQLMLECKLDVEVQVQEAVILPNEGFLVLEVLSNLGREKERMILSKKREMELLRGLG